MHLKKLLALVVVGGIALSAVLASAQTKQTKTKGAKAAAGKARVFFVEPKNGATVTSPVHLKFGSQGIKIEAVPPGDVTKTRPGIGHYHLGVEENCLPAGKNIVKGTPSWVHFGKAETEFDLQLTPGKHKLSLQIGDDLHNTMPGLCSTITVTAK